MNIVPYKREYIRDKFDCGKPPLNNYILRNATADVENGACTCFVILNDESEVVGYYTLSSSSISRDEIPKELKGKIKYADIPIVLLGRLARDKNYKGTRAGERLLLDALLKSMKTAKETIGARAVVVDPIDHEAVTFYEKYGFKMIPDSGKMFITIKEIEDSFNVAFE